MLKRRIYLAQQQSRVKVLAQTYHHNRTVAWLAALGTAALMGIFYFYSLFFSFSKWRIVAE